MTNEEAIKWCRDFQDNIVDVTDKLEDKHTMALKAVNKAIEALAKQMPKKTTWTERSDKNHEYIAESWCPNCECEVDDNNNYCPHCGQALDWSNNND